MGNFFSKTLLRFFISAPELRAIMVGLDGAGKTTMLYKLKLNEVVHSVPTIGFNVETLSYKNATINVWDIGGQDKIRPLWSYYYQNTQAVIFVVDASDVQRLDEARDELHRVAQADELRNAVILVYANKQDLPHALGAGQLADRLQLRAIPQQKCHVEASCLPRGDGLYEGLEWLVNTLRH